MRSSMNEVPFRKEICTYRPFADGNMMAEKMEDQDLDISEISNSLKDVESLQSLVDSDYVDDLKDLGKIKEMLLVASKKNGMFLIAQKPCHTLPYQMVCTLFFFKSNPPDVF